MLHKRQTDGSTTDREDSPLLSGENPTCKGCLVAMDQVSYSVTVKGHEKALLRDISLVVRPGELLAIMGGSGAGKSTLMELLSCRKRAGIIYGRILYNGYKVGPADSWRCALVARDDHHVATMSVEEILTFTARLRMPRASLAAVSMRVAEVLRMLLLEDVKTTRVGNAIIRGISGGQRKRLSIGVGLLAMPEIVLLDEPTTGLDSRSARVVMASVQRICTRPNAVTIAATIHTPSPEILKMFAKLVIVRAGRIMYYGPASEVASALAAKPYDLVFSADRKNAADVALGAIGSQSRSASEIEAMYQQTAQYTRLREVASKVVEVSELFTRSLTWLEAFDQIKVLSQRSFTDATRQSAVIKSNLLKLSWTGFLYATVYFNQNTDKTGWDNVCACTFFTLIFGILGNLRGLQTLIDDREWFRTERSAGTYSTFVYFVVTCIVHVPLVFVNNAIFSTFIFYMVGLGHTNGKHANWGHGYFYWILITFTFNMTGFAVAQLIASMSSSTAAAMSIWQPLMYLMIQTTGYTVRQSSTFEYQPIHWLLKLSFTRYGYEAAFLSVFYNGWGDDVNRWYAREFYFGSAGYRSFNKESWFCFGILCCNFVAIRICTYWALTEVPARLVYKEGTEGSELPPPVDTSSTSDIINGAKIELSKVARNAGLEGGVIDASMRTIGMAVEDVMRLSEPSANSLDSRQSSPDICLKNFSYRVLDEATNDPRVLLHDLNATIRGGRLTCIMGPSGAGKTTLLDVLAGRKNDGWYIGNITAYGGPIDMRFSHQSVYVTQHDSHLQQLSLAETITFAARFRNKPDVSLEDLMDSVRRVIVELKLEKVANTNVGNLSNGQKRRLTLACEIVTAPKTIFLDEPLSGLDSVSALEVATSIRALAIAGRTVVCTIHQPSSAVFALVDDLLLLVDGQVTYNGAVPTDADEPSEQIIETLMTSKSINSQVENQVKNMLPLLDPEEDMEIAVACFQPIGSLQGADTALDLFPLAPPSRAGFELRVLMSRNVLVLKRSILATRMSLLRTVGVTTIMLVIYWKAGDSYHSITSCLYFTMQYVVMQSMQVIPKFIGERKIFLHESASGLYTSTVYFHSHFYLYMLQMLLHIPIICTCVYFGVNFTNKGIGNFFFFVFIYYGLSMLGFSYATLIANVTPNVQTALNLFSTSFVFWIFFSGYAVVVHSVPKLWKWAPSVSYARWAFEALCINAFSGDTHESNGKNGDGYLTYLGFMNLANKHGSTRAKFIALGIFSAVWFFFHLLANASFSYARRQLRT